MQRRLDDGKSPAAGGKPGNMYKHLGENDAERAANLAKIKAWLGDGAWNLNRWGARGDVPAVAKEQLDKDQGQVLTSRRRQHRAPPAQIPTRAIRALGSQLECLASKP
jgi:hypothetical protein